MVNFVGELADTFLDLSPALRLADAVREIGDDQVLELRTLLHHHGLGPALLLIADVRVKRALEAQIAETRDQFSNSSEAVMIRKSAIDPPQVIDGETFTYAEQAMRLVSGAET